MLPLTAVDSEHKQPLVCNQTHSVTCLVYSFVWDGFDAVVIILKPNMREDLVLTSFELLELKTQLLSKNAKTARLFLMK